MSEPDDDWGDKLYPCDRCGESTICRDLKHTARWEYLCPKCWAERTEPEATEATKTPPISKHPHAVHAKPTKWDAAALNRVARGV